MCDWYATFAALAGVDPTDHKAEKAKLPPIDSLNLWPYLSGQVEASPRNEVFADPGVLIMGDWKLIGGARGGGNVGTACWMGPEYPNGSSNPGCSRSENCKETGGCLYNIKEDPGEHSNVAASNPKELKQLQTRLETLEGTCFNPKRGGGDPKLPIHYARDVYHGYWGPFIDVSSSKRNTESSAWVV